MGGFLDSFRVGIYRITCIPNGRVYIGSSNDLALRKNQHFEELRSGKHVNVAMQKDYNKYGAPAFTWEVVEYTSRGNRTRVEQEWINRSGNVYNSVSSSVKKRKTFRVMLNAILRAIKEALF